MIRTPPDEEAPNWEPPADSVELESELPPDSPAAPEPEPDPDAPGPPGTLTDDAKALIAAAREGLDAWNTHAKALKRLFLEEFALARDSVVYALVFLLLGMVLLATSYALLTALFVVGLRWAGLPWVFALLIPLVVSTVLAALGLLRARALFRYSDFESTRRQLSRGLAVPKEAEPTE